MAQQGRRLFFALWPDDAVRQALAHWQMHNLPASLRWQHRADLHMTLHFLGHVDVASIDDLTRIGAQSASDAFSLVIDTVGYWPDAQVLWAGPTSPPGDLPALHERLADRLSAAGFELDARAYCPHLTLARHVTSAIETGPLKPFTWMVDRFALVESRPGPPPFFHPLKIWTLR
jgi:2'-5' RNA ligase